MSKDTGGSAFPNDGAWANGHPEGGMTLRDYFAANAILAVCMKQRAGDARTDEGDTERYARLAYAVADAMLAERAKDGAA
jgi:hypothetical protein